VLVFSLAESVFFHGDVARDIGGEENLTSSGAVEDLHSPRPLEIHFKSAIEAAKIDHLPVLQLE